MLTFNEIRHGKAGRGSARQGLARYGSAWYFIVWESNPKQYSQGEEWRVQAGHGGARHDMEFYHAFKWFNSKRMPTRHGRARQGTAWQGTARLGMAGHGKDFNKLKVLKW